MYARADKDEIRNTLREKCGLSLIDSSAMGDEDDEEDQETPFLEMDADQLRCQNRFVEQARGFGPAARHLLPLPWSRRKQHSGTVQEGYPFGEWGTFRMPYTHPLQNTA
jgi:hypothetical protein